MLGRPVLAKRPSANAVVQLQMLSERGRDVSGSGAETDRKSFGVYKAEVEVQAEGENGQFPEHLSVGTSEQCKPSDFFFERQYAILTHVYARLGYWTLPAGIWPLNDSGNTLKTQ